MWPNLQFTLNLVKSTEEILNGKLYFLWCVSFFTILVFQNNIILKNSLNLVQGFWTLIPTVEL